MTEPLKHMIDAMQSKINNYTLITLIQSFKDLKMKRTHRRVLKVNIVLLAYALLKVEKNNKTFKPHYS